MRWTFLGLMLATFCASGGAWLATMSDYWYWQVGLIRQPTDLDFNVAYTDTSIEPAGCGNTNYCAGRFFVSVTKVF